MLLSNSDITTVTMQGLITKELIINFGDDIDTEMIHVINQNDKLSMFSKLMSDEGYELSKSSELRIFQIMSELLLILSNESPTVSNNTTLLINIVTRELNTQLHSEYLDTISNTFDTVEDIVKICLDIGLNTLVLSSGPRISIPVKWSYSHSSLLLHVNTMVYHDR